MPAVDYDAPITLKDGPDWVKAGRTTTMTLQLSGLDILALNFPAIDDYRKEQLNKGFRLFAKGLQASIAASPADEDVDRLLTEYYASRQRAYTFATILVEELNELRGDGAHIKLAAAPDRIHGWSFDLSKRYDEGSVLSIFAPNHKPGIPFCTVENDQVCASHEAIEDRVLRALRISLFIGVGKAIRTVFNEMPTHLNDQRTSVVPNTSALERPPKVDRTNLWTRLRGLWMR